MSRPTTPAAFLHCRDAGCHERHICRRYTNSDRLPAVSSMRIYPVRLGQPGQFCRDRLPLLDGESS